VFVRAETRRQHVIARNKNEWMGYKIRLLWTGSRDSIWSRISCLQNSTRF